MAFAMPGKKGDALAGKTADADRPRRHAVRRDRLVAFDVGQFAQCIHAGAADHGKIDVHRHSPSA